MWYIQFATKDFAFSYIFGDNGELGELASVNRAGGVNNSLCPTFEKRLRCPMGGGEVENLFLLLIKKLSSDNALFMCLDPLTSFLWLQSYYWKCWRHRLSQPHGPHQFRVDDN